MGTVSFQEMSRRHRNDPAEKSVKRWGSLASSYGKAPARLSQAEHGEVGASSQQIPLDSRQ
jgi:hypothetical protein